MKERKQQHSYCIHLLGYQDTCVKEIPPKAFVKVPLRKNTIKQMDVCANGHYRDKRVARKDTCENHISTKDICAKDLSANPLA